MRGSGRVEEGGIRENGGMGEEGGRERKGGDGRDWKGEGERQRRRVKEGGVKGRKEKRGGES